MKKEIVISIIIVFLVVISDFFTSNITDNRINNMNYSLNKMKENIINNESRDNKLILEAENIKRKWEDDNNILSYYIEHEELEKVGTEISSLYNYVESNDINQALDSITRLEFILDHISKKYDFELNNFF